MRRIMMKQLQRWRRGAVLALGLSVSVLAGCSDLMDVNLPAQLTDDVLTSPGNATILVNTFIALAINPETRRPRIGAGFGGLSGPAIKPIALRLVCQAARSVRIPVVGLGGIASGVDAAEFLIAGATAVEVGTATFWDPRAPLRIAEELAYFLRRQKVARVTELVGSLKL
jgi:dihydroorotate dehydrogenase (NAD+) catalytic subunit